MVVFAAVRIESGSAIRALVVCAHIFVNCQFGFANSAEDGFSVNLIFIPYPCLMAGSFFMTLITGIIFVAAFEFYGNNVDRGAVMFAPGIIVHNFTIYFDLSHTSAKVKNDLEKRKFV